VPDDRFGDLSRRPSAAEPLDAQDVREPRAATPEPPPPARPGARYTWVVGVAALIAIAVVVVNLLSVGVGASNLGPEPGETVPDFAAPAATSETEGDANIRQGAEGTEEEGPVPACEVAEEDVVNICELRERPLVLTFVVEGCERALDQIERLRGDFPGVSFVGVVSESTAVTNRLAEGDRWGFPVARDADNAVFNLYRAGDCPTTVFAERGGEVADTTLGYQTEAELRAAIDDIAPRGA
jgi:hypothetical protein